MAVNDIESGTGAHVNEQEDRSPKGHIRDSESQKNSSANGNESREYRSPATQTESEADVNSELGEGIFIIHFHSFSFQSFSKANNKCYCNS